MFDSSVITLTHELSGVSSYTLVSGNSVKYIVGASIQQSQLSSTSVLMCGTTVIARNYGKDFPYNPLNYRCSEPINLSKTGQDSASFIISYVPYDRTSFIASESAQIISRMDQSAIGMQGIAFIMWISFAIVLFLMSFRLGIFIYKRV
jgi:hypothetical protein